jgi:hypothetical protein
MLPKPPPTGFIKSVANYVEIEQDGFAVKKCEEPLIPDMFSASFPMVRM